MAALLCLLIVSSAERGPKLYPASLCHVVMLCLGRRGGGREREGGSRECGKRKQPVNGDECLCLGGGGKQGYIHTDS